MIPLYDRNRTRRIPFITIGLIAANVLVFFYQLNVGYRGGDAQLNSLIEEYGVRPACVVGYLTGHDRIAVKREVPTFFGLVRTYVEYLELSAKVSLLPLLTSLFLHAGWAHILGNMWFLWIFGDNIEDRLGHVTFLLFYLAGGIAASLVHIAMTMLFSENTLIPTIGASGAVSAVLGAYLYAFPHARIVTLLPIFFFLYLVEIPAFLYLLFWFVVQQVLPGLGSLGHMGSGGVAFWAHIGGFAVGLLVMLRLAPRKAPPPPRYLSLQ